MTTLQVVWFILLGGMLAVYAILDGFDLGVGFWSMFTRKDEDKRVLLNSIGPVWDGNEVWLVTAGVIMFAAFPPVYAAVFSGMYLALMLLLVALVARAVSIEFRSQLESRVWRAGWDWAFGLGSTVAILLFGVALGNMLHGFPLNESGDYTGGFFDLLNPYSLLIGVLAVTMLAMHGALWIALKAEGPLFESAMRWAARAWLGYTSLWVITGIVTAAFYPNLLSNYVASPALFVLPVLAVAAICGVWFTVRKEKLKSAFLLSSGSIALNMALVGASLFPNLVYSRGAPENSLTIHGASASEYALTVILVLTLIGMPIVLGYTWFVYRSFRGKVSSSKLVY